MIFHIQAYDKEKRYGRALNNHIQYLPDDAWICVTDGDTMKLTSHAMGLCEEAIEDHPDVDLFTCATNRAYGQGFDPERDIVIHHDRASRLEMGEKKYTPIRGVVPAFFWLFPKRLWVKHPFDDAKIISGANSFDSRWMKGKKWKMMRIQHLYVFHFYRLHKNKLDYSHLK